VTGAMVGDFVGAEVGDFVGAEVGEFVGAEVGSFVGEGVVTGARVAACIVKVFSSVTSALELSVCTHSVIPPALPPCFLFGSKGSDLSSMWVDCFQHLQILRFTWNFASVPPSCSQRSAQAQAELAFILPPAFNQPKTLTPPFTTQFLRGTQVSFVGATVGMVTAVGLPVAGVGVAQPSTWLPSVSTPHSQAPWMVPRLCTHSM
jgi:hypothetical protein